MLQTPKNSFWGFPEGEITYIWTHGCIIKALGWSIRANWYHKDNLKQQKAIISKFQSVFET